MVLGDDLAVVRAGKRLDTALEHADQNRQNPELHGRFHEERGEEHDAHVCHDRRRDHRLAAESRRQTAVENRAGEGHELRDEQCHHQLGGVDAKLGTVGGTHRNHRVHGVDVEEERDHEHPQRLVLHDFAERARQFAERAAHGRAQLVAGGTVMHLAVAGEQRDGECHPPDGGDDERGARASHRGPAEERRAAENQRDAEDERHGGADVAPAVAVRGDLVHALVRGGVDEHRIIERQRAVQADGRQNVDDQERQPGQGQGHCAAGDHAGAEEAQEELDLHALYIGDGAKQRHEQRDDQGGNGLRVAPGGHDVAVRRHQRFGVDGDDGGGEQHECRIADVVDDPLLFAGGQFGALRHRFVDIRGISHMHSSTVFNSIYRRSAD